MNLTPPAQAALAAAACSADELSSAMLLGELAKSENEIIAATLRPENVTAAGEPDEPIGAEMLVRHAEATAQQMGHQVVGSEHLLLALAESPTGVGERLRAGAVHISVRKVLAGD